MGEAASREALAQSPTAKDSDSTKDLPIISTVQNINQPETCDEALPPVCSTDLSRCGSFLSSDGPCPRYARRGCPLRHQEGYQAVTGPTPATRTPGPAPMFTSSTGDWYTPPEIVEAVRELFGIIDLDPCSNSHEAPNVPALVHFTREDDGLSRPWFGRVYLNPPYGKGIGPWIEKVREEHEAGRVTAAVVLVKAATDTRWFRVLSERYPRCEVAGRLKFSGCKNPAPFPSVLFYLGDEVQRFAEVFARFGVLVAPLPAARGAEEVPA
ncbi:MAG: DNA N-6-adenine-methyltransferase [Candidatus Methanoculleus thermohydrogenotrophicum]|nr:DNA N-6-adenine-methyltransferase [Candidatus Methanoculleus thermohydrogenotrophicum]